MQRFKSIALVAILVLIIGIGTSLLGDLFGVGKSESLEVRISDGAGTQSIASMLKENDVITHPLLFRLYVRTKETPAWKKGWHRVDKSMSYRELYRKLQSAPDAEEMHAVRVVIPEGYELRQIVDLLVEEGLGDRDAFYQEIASGVFDYPFIAQIPERENRLEGYLYPDTYLFSREESEHQILDKMLKAFSQKALPLYEEAGSAYTLDEILIMASVIEREAANDAERPLVASVFYNRIDIGMKLESCATVQYILKERKDILSNRDTAIDSPYNTYRYAGLPYGPIASPGEASIRAALSPAETKYLYFVATADGSENLFSKTFEEHNRKTIETQSN